MRYPTFPAQRAPVPPGVPALLRDLIHERTGLFFENDRLDTMIDKLSERVAVHSCQSYLEYYTIYQLIWHYTEEGI